MTDDDGWGSVGVTGYDLIRQLREAVGLSMDSGVKAITPRQAWEDALSEARAARKALQDAQRAQAMMLLAQGGRIDVPDRVVLDMPSDDNLSVSTWHDPIRHVLVFAVERKGP